MERIGDLGMPAPRRNRLESSCPAIPRTEMKTSLELFTGAGGIALGLSRAGFRHVDLIEHDSAACETIRHNQKGGVRHVIDWRLREEDVALIDFTTYKSVDLLAGGPPCQPFAISGSRRAHGDNR